MAQVEFTQQFKYTALGAGNTGEQGFLMQSIPGVYIVKALTCYSTSGLNVGSTYSLQLANSTSPTGGTIIYGTNVVTTSNEVIPIFDPTKQIILNNPYLCFIAIMAGAGDLIITISYSFIPTSNTLSNNFKETVANISNTVGAPLVGLSATEATIIKSINVVNTTNLGPSTVTPYLTTGSTTIALDSPQTLAAGNSYTYALPLYINNTQTITIGSIGSGVTVSVHYSYTQGI